MLNDALALLVTRGQHLILSGSRPLALQRAAGLLLKRLHDHPAVQVADEAPADQQALIEHVNRIIQNLSLSEATDAGGPAQLPAILPVRVAADRTMDSIALLARLCRALPGADVRLLLIVEYADSLADCMRALGNAAVHIEVTPESIAGESDDTLPLAGAAGPAPASVRTGPLARASTASTGWWSRLVDAATRRPLRFAILAIGVPGLLIALILAFSLARGPSAPTKPATSTGPGAKLNAAGAATPAPAAPAPSTTPPPPAASPLPGATAQAASPASAASAGSTATGSSPVTPAPPAPNAPSGTWACSTPPTPPPQTQARNPSKDAGMVYVVAPKPTAICVTDASGKTERHDLLAEQGKSFFGKPPWQLQSPALRDLQIFFQGSKITLPRGASDRVELTEQRPNP